MEIPRSVAEVVRQTIPTLPAVGKVTLANIGRGPHGLGSLAKLPRVLLRRGRLVHARPGRDSRRAMVRGERANLMDWGRAVSRAGPPHAGRDRHEAGHDPKGRYAWVLVATPLSASIVSSSPDWNISVTMSQPPTNSPLT